MRSYRPEELFDEDGALRARAAPRWRPGHRRMGANPHANGGRLLRELEPARLSRLRRRRAAPRRSRSPRPPASLGEFLRDVIDAEPAATSASSVPTRRPPTASAAVFEVTDRVVEDAESCAADDHLAPDGRVMEVLSEHHCQGWLEGYLLTGRHGLFTCYEAFIHIVDSMFNQHAKWLKVTPRDPLAAAHRLAELPADLPRLAPGPQRLHPPGPGLHRPCGQQEGRGHPRLPAARRQHACCRSADHCLRSRNYVNVIVAGKQPAAAVARYGRGDRALHRGHRHLGVGQQRRRRRARRGDGLLRRRADARDAGRGRDCCASIFPT